MILSTLNLIIYIVKSNARFETIVDFVNYVVIIVVEEKHAYYDVIIIKS